MERAGRREFGVLELLRARDLKGGIVRREPVTDGLKVYSHPRYERIRVSFRTAEKRWQSFQARGEGVTHLELT